MLLGGLFRKYKRWNPVHPTAGSAFWGIGAGVGCGVGWGPGFGPEVVGFVGAGCGLGFSVGLTLVGVGVGLPSNGPARLPWNALVFAGQRTSNFASAVILPAMMLAVQQGGEGLFRQAAAFDRGVRTWYVTHMPRVKKSIVDSQNGFQRDARSSGGEAGENLHRSSKPPQSEQPRSAPLTPPPGAPKYARGPEKFLPPTSRDRK